ncbi:MAG: ATP-binding cassette domain-containing protein [Candidatus Hydrogenedentota bacterium]
MIEAHRLSKTFYAPRSAPIEAVRDVSLSVEGGEILGLLGPNGAGKTTLLRMLATILTPTSGSCRVCGVPVNESPQTARAKIGFLSGNTRLYGRLTPRELLRYFGRLYGMSRENIAERTESLSAMLGMEGFLDRRCDTLSTGQTQRVSIARVILHDPPVLILDEPTLGLDIMSSRTILDFIREARTREHAIIFSTHYMTEAELLCDRIGLIHEGRVHAMDTPANLYARTQTRNLQDAFLAMIDAEPAMAGDGHGKAGPHAS